ncbi:hypothetical protein D3C80_1445630 [compost metagenome]
MPIRGPALVHDLGLHLRPEVEHFFTQHGHNITLPVFKRFGVFLDEPDNVLFRLRREDSWSVVEPGGRIVLHIEGP